MFAIGVKVCKMVRGLRSHKRNSSYRHRGAKFFFQDFLLLTNSITSGACMSLGDLIQQEIEYQNEYLKNRYDWGRAGRMLISGTLIGPAHHYYYIYLDKIMPIKTVKTVFYKVASDQLIAGPFTIIFFFYCMGVLERKSFAECNDEIDKKFTYVYLGDWIFWPPIQIINFWFLPTHLRLVYINVATMVFNVFMSYMKHYDQYSHAPESDSDTDNDEPENLPLLGP